MPLVDQVAHGLPDEVVGDRPAAQAVLLQQGVPPGQVAVLAQRPVHLEVIPPARQLEAVVPPRAGQPGHLFQRQVRPLAGEQGERMRHGTLRGLVDRGPHAPVRRAGRHGVQHPLDLQAVAERRLRVSAGGDVGEQVAGLIDERVLPAQHVPGRPPRLQVRVAGLGDQDAPEPGGRLALGAVVEAQLVQPLQVEGQAAQLTVQLDGQGVLPPGGEPGGLEQGHGAGRQPPGEQGRVVHRDRAGRLLPRRLPGGRARPGPFGHEGGHQPGHAGQGLTSQVLGQIDGVRADVTQRAGAGPFPLQPPGQRDRRVGQPVLQVGRADVAQRADPARHDQPPGQRDGRHPAVVEPDHGAYAVRAPHEPRRRPSPRLRPACWPAASRTARACPRPAPRSRSRRACRRACRCPPAARRRGAISARQSVSACRQPNRCAAARVAAPSRPASTAIRGRSGTSNAWATVAQARE